MTRPCVASETATSRLRNTSKNMRAEVRVRARTLALAGAPRSVRRLVQMNCRASPPAAYGRRPPARLACLAARRRPCRERAAPPPGARRRSSGSRPARAAAGPGTRSLAAPRRCRSGDDARRHRRRGGTPRRPPACSDDSSMTSCSMHCSSVMRSPTSARVQRRATSTKPFVEAEARQRRVEGHAARPPEKQWPTKLGEGRVGWNAALRRQQFEQHHAATSTRPTSVPAPVRDIVGSR